MRFLEAWGELEMQEKILSWSSAIYMLLTPSKNSSRFRRLGFLLQKSCLLFLNMLLLFMYSLILFFTGASANMTHMDIGLSGLRLLESPLDLF